MSSRLPACCPDFLRRGLHRRRFLTVGGLTALSLPQLLRAEERAAGRSRKGTARSVILLFQFGGPSQLDTFDPKPDAPAEIRGEFRAIPTCVPGVRFSE